MDDQISLVFVPEPFLDESPASWLMRVREYHQSWPNQLFRVFGLVNIRDIDLDLNLDSLRKLCRGTKISSTELDLLARKFAKVRKKEYAEAFLLHRNKAKAGCYRICPDCLKCDKTPYWRLTWRMSHIQICVHHQCRLIWHCMNCKAQIGPWMNQPKQLHDQALKHWCRYCSNCGTDLANSPGARIHSVDVVNRVGLLQQTITAALVHGYFRIEGLTESLSLSHLPRALLAGANPKNSDYLFKTDVVAKEIKGYLTSPFGMAALTKSNLRNKKWMSNKVSTRRTKLVKYARSHSRLKSWMDIATNLRISFYLHEQDRQTENLTMPGFSDTYPYKSNLRRRGEKI